MQWIALTVRTASEGVELLCMALTQAGFDSFEVEDSGEFQTFLKTAGDYWDYVDEALAEKMRDCSLVRLYLDSASANEQLPALRELLHRLPDEYPACDFGSLTLSMESVPDEDWENSWKESYRPLPIGEKLVVVPQWMQDGAPQGRLPIVLDLGLTFGTGEHASTRMCLESLEALVHGGERVADLGSGSGILSIAALRLGAESAVGVDVDPAAEHIAAQNAAQNGFGADRFRACTGNVVTDEALMHSLAAGGYDIVCANIVAGVLVRLAPVVPNFLKSDGIFLCSGILDEREQEVRDTLNAAGLTVTTARHSDGWCCLTARN